MFTSPWAKILRVILALSGVAGLAGCLEVERTITLNADGSGTVYMSYGMKPEDLQDLKEVLHQQMAEEGLDPGQAETPFDFDEESARRGFEQYRADGITLKELKREEVNGRKYIRLTIGFTSLEGLSRTEFLSDGDIRLVRRPDGNYEFGQSGPQGETVAELAGAQEMMAEVMKGFRATVTVHTPGPVLESNADHAEDRSVQWQFDLSRDPKALERAQKLDMRVVFDGRGLSLPEFRSPGAR